MFWWGFCNLVRGVFLPWPPSSIPYYSWEIILTPLRYTTWNLSYPFTLLPLLRNIHKIASNTVDSEKCWNFLKNESCPGGSKMRFIPKLVAPDSIFIFFLNPIFQQISVFSVNFIFSAAIPSAWKLSAVNIFSKHKLPVIPSAWNVSAIYPITLTRQQLPLKLSWRVWFPLKQNMELDVWNNYFTRLWNFPARRCLRQT